MQVERRLVPVSFVRKDREGGVNEFFFLPLSIFDS